MISPSCAAVFALKFLQKSMMFTPCGPSAVPTGGAGVALPAGICSFTLAWAFFAITLSRVARFPTTRRRLQTATYRLQPALDLLHLQEIELHGCRTPENGDHHL